MENNENNINLTPEEAELPDTSNVPEENLLKADNDYDKDMWITNEQKGEKPKEKNKLVLNIFDLIETLAMVTIVIVLSFAFLFRLNIVDGPSMNNTLHTGEYLLVSDFLYEPTPGDIVVVQDLTAGRYDKPLVKRVIATEGQTVDIDFLTWTVTVDGKAIDESSYVFLEYDHVINGEHYVNFPLTVKENHVFVMGDNRYASADSRLREIGQIDERCVVGKVYARIFPFNKFTIFNNPYGSAEQN